MTRSRGLLFFLEDGETEVRSVRPADQPKTLSTSQFAPKSRLATNAIMKTANTKVTVVYATSSLRVGQITLRSSATICRHHKPVREKTLRRSARPDCGVRRGAAPLVVSVTWTPLLHCVN